MRRIGSDTDGITEISLKSLNRLTDKMLTKIDIEKGEFNHLFRFNFEDGTYYEASGFGIGYRGEGARGLYSIINSFETKWRTFEDSKIENLDFEKSYIWTFDRGFEEV